MKIKILGTGCAKCRMLLAETETAVSAAGVEAEIEKVENIDDILQYGIMVTPALVIDDEVKASGRVPRSAEIASWIGAAMSKGAR